MLLVCGINGNTVGLHHSWYLRSGRTEKFEFPPILASSIHTPFRCKWMDYTAHHLYKTILSEKRCDYSSFMHYVFAQIFRYFHACASMKAEVLHFQTSPDRLISLQSRNRCCRKQACRSQRPLSVYPN
ncbi:hypothetical protein T01_14993, partial [Trichinella spiralis]